jgi:Mg-chelatase subunit ChlD
MVFFWKKADDKGDKKEGKKGDKKDNGEKQREAESSRTNDMTLPIRGAPPPYTPQADDDTEEARLTLHPSIAPTPGLLVKLSPPKQPNNGLLQTDGHVGCDIVLVIDVSGSMGDNAPIPGGGNEDYGLSVLDLVKHAARTIVATLNEGDRLGVVKFASSSSVVQGLTPMTDANKVATNKRIDELRPLDCTNLWHGIKSGLEQFKGEGESGRVPAVMVLTDGMPNVS